MQDSKTSDLYWEKDQKFHFQTYKRYPVTLKKGRGHTVWDVDNNRYIDAFGGISVHNIGHCHEKVVKAIQYQAAELMHVSNFFVNEPAAMLCEQLTQLSGMDRVFLCNTGAEAVEGAIKLARKYHWNKKQKNGTILTMTNCFHGRTLATTAAGKQKFHEGFGPIPAGFEQIPFNDATALEKAFEEHDVVAIIIELVQGEGGIHIASQDYVSKMQKLCRDNDALLITDQVQCGLGRAGKWFTNEHYNIKPDIITNAKALGGGIPIGAIQTTEEIASALEFGQHGTTFGGNPLASTAALATLKVLREEDLPNRSLKEGKALKDKLQSEGKHIKGIKEVRGLGLMIGVDLNFKGDKVLARMREKGILVNLTAETIIRLLPPLNTSVDTLNFIADKLLETIKEEEK